MIQQALDTYSELHSIVNPAGILRDKMFHKWMIKTGML